MNIKKYLHSRRSYSLVLLAVICVLMLMLASCEQKPDDTISVNALQEKIEIKTEAYVTDLTDSRSGLTTNDKMAKYIVNWAESKGIRVKTDGDLIIMNVDGSEAYKNAPKTVIICPYDEADFDGTMNSLIVAFYVLKNNEDTGRLTALFLPETAHDLSSADLLKKKYFGDRTKVICLSGGEHAAVAHTTGGASRYVFRKNYDLIKPKNRLAYRITIKGIKNSVIDNSINTKINPIVELNALLAGLKSSAIDYEIGSMRGGKDGLLYPGRCVLTITVDEDKQAAFEKKILARIDSFDKRKKTADPEAVYEYEETRLPGKVISQQDSSELAGFIYTLLEDEYHQDEDTDMLQAVCDVSYIRTGGGKIRIGSNACCIDDERLSEIDEAERTLSGLSGFKYKKTFSYPAWNNVDEEEPSEFETAFKKAYKKYTGKKLKIDPQVTPSYGSKVAELNKKTDALAITVSDNSLTDLTGAVMEYLIQSNIKQE